MKVVRDHVLSRDAYTVSTNIGSYVSLDYDGATHPVDLNTRLIDGTLAFPPMADLTAGMLIRVTYDAQLGVDPLISSSVPRILQVQIVGRVPTYEITVLASPINTSELENPNLVVERVRQRIQGTATVTGLR